MLSICLRSLRENMGLKQKEAAEKLGINQVTYNRYEQGEREPDIKTLMQLAKFYNVTTDYLLGYNKESAINYSFEHSNNLIEIYLQGIEAWTDSEFLSLDEKRIIKEHFAELLFKYKELINKTVDQLAVWPEYKESTNNFYNNQPNKLTPEKIKELYLRQSLEQDIDIFERYIRALPFLLSRVESNAKN